MTTPRFSPFASITIAGFTAVSAAYMLGMSKAGEPNATFSEITVERINIVEADGTLKMVLSNSARQAPAIIDGRELMPDRTRPPGLIFFNDRGDEMGGLTYDGGHATSGIGLTLDQYQQDQTVALMQQDWPGDDGTRAGLSGMKVWDRPATSLADALDAYQAAMAIEDEDEKNAALTELQSSGAIGTDRLFVARDVSGDAALALRDAAGVTRLVVSVSPEGDARIDFLDGTGAVVKSITADGI